MGTKPSLKMCWTSFKTIGHSLKILGLFAVAKLTVGQGWRPPPLAGHFEVFGPPVTTLLILLSDL